MVGAGCRLVNSVVSSSSPEAQISSAVQMALPCEVGGVIWIVDSAGKHRQGVRQLCFDVLRFSSAHVGVLFQC